MRKNSLYVIISFLVASVAFASCLDSDDQAYELTSDALISSFSIGNIGREVMGKTHDGKKDSVYVDSIRCDNYRFSINQLTGEIYNTDSLPAGTPVDKVVTRLEMTYGYYATYVKNGKDTIWSSTDSIDFTGAVVFKAFALDGTQRNYTVRLNVHRQDPDSLQWTKVESNFQLMSAEHKAVYYKGVMGIYYKLSGEVRLMASGDGASWRDAELDATGKTIDYTSVIAGDEAVYALADNRLYGSFNGTSWEMIQTELKFKQLLGYSVKNGMLYALSEDETHILAASVDEDFTVWSEAGAIEAGTFPTKNISYTALPLSSNANIERLTLVGTGSHMEDAAQEDSVAAVWSKLSNDDEWIFVDRRHQSNTDYQLPNLEKLATVAFDGKLYAFGGRGVTEKNVKTPAFQYIYESRDYGLSWKPQESKIMFPMKEGSTERAFLNRAPEFSCLVDDDGYLWMFWNRRVEDGEMCPAEVWKGRINRLGFAQ